jgi:secretory phospholipase A2
LLKERIKLELGKKIVFMQTVLTCCSYRSSCDCDEKFYDCLKIANTLVSRKIGITYFNVLRPKCFRKDHPVSGCEKYEG